MVCKSQKVCQSGVLKRQVAKYQHADIAPLNMYLTIPGHDFSFPMFSVDNIPEGWNLST